MKRYKIELIKCCFIVIAMISCKNDAAHTSDLNLENGVVDYEISPGVIGLYIKRDYLGGHHAEEKCTGTIVRHDLVLTAAHCFARGAENHVYPYQNLEKEGEVEGLKSRGLKSSLFVTHPNFKHGDLRNLYSILGSDLAFVVFQKNTFANWPKPLKFASISPQEADQVTLIGYGMGDVGAKWGIRRSGTNDINMIVKTHSDAIRLHHTWGSKKARPHFGDSGGPLLNKNGEIIGTLTGEEPFSRLLC